jgi:hypothetical protein
MGKVSLAIVLMATFAGVAYADMVSPGLNFNAAGDSVTANLTASGSATIGGSGTYYSWVGWPVSTWASVTISIGTQTVGLGTNPDTININKDPSGTGQVSFERLFTTLDNAGLDALNVDLTGGSPQSLALDRIEVDGEVIGLIPVTIGLDASGSLGPLNYDMSYATTLGGNGQFYVSPLKQASYYVIPVGNASAGYSASIDADIDVGGLFTIDLGEIASLSGTESLGDVPLIVNMVLKELGPDDGVYPKDVSFDMSIAFDESISVPFTTAGTESISTYAGNKNEYYKINFNYDFDGNLDVSNISLALHDTIENIIPEPMTVAVLGIGGALLSLSRRRKG